MASAGMEAIFKAAGITEETGQYLTARGINLVSTLGMMADKTDEFYARVAQPFLTGTNIAGVEHKTTEDHDVLKAKMVVAWQMARKEVIEATTPTPPTQAAQTTPVKVKAPLTLEVGVWKQQIDKYNAVLINGVARKFPEKAILGAETVLARMWHEIHVTKLYTPVRLGEVLAHRFYTASGEMNRLALEPKKDRVLALDDRGQLHEQDQPIWDPKNHMAVLDALDAIRWAWIFVEIASEPAINEWIDFFLRLIRSRPNKLDNTRKLWDMAGWRVALEMRSGGDFDRATRQVMDDAVFQNDIMTATVTPQKDQTRPPRKPEHRINRSRSPPANKPPSQQTCNNFAKGTCRMGDRCRYLHTNASRTTKGKGKGKKGQRPVGGAE